MKRLLPALLLILPVLAENPLKVELVSNAKVIAPGEMFMVGLHLKPPAGFHTYWKHPGIVGLATSVEWDLPPGFTAGEIHWPAPETVKMARYTAQGYRGETLLMVPMAVPADIQGTSVKLTARVSWMCCGDQCHPGSKVPFSLTLPVAAESETDLEKKAMFLTYGAKLPQPDKAWSTTVVRSGKTLILIVMVVDPKEARDVAELGKVRFFTADGQVDSDGEQKVTIGPGQIIRMELPLSESGPATTEGLPGVVMAEKSWSKRGGPLGLEVK